MTIPGGYVDYNSLWGTDSNLASQEFQTMLLRRKQLVDSIMERMSVRSQIADTVKPKEQDQVADQLVNRTLRPSELENRDSLYGAAQFYDIPNYDKMPLEALSHIVEQRRMQVRGSSGPNSMLEQAGLGAATTLTGTLQGAVSLARNLPFIGKAIGDSQVLNQLNQKMNEWNEGLTASSTPEDKAGLQVANTIGQVGGQMIAATPVWKLAGAVMARGLGVATAARDMNLISRASRSGLQGAVMGTILEAGKDAPLSQKVRDVGISAGLGAGAEALAAVIDGAPLFTRRVRESFRTPWDEAPATAEAPPALRQLSGLGEPDYTVEPLLSGTPTTEAGFSLGAGQAPLPISRQLAAGTPEPIAAGPVGSTGGLPPSRGLPGPSQLQQHYTDMASQMAETHPEISLRLQQIADQMGSAAPVGEPVETTAKWWLEQAAPEYKPMGQTSGTTMAIARIGASNLSKRATIAESPAVTDMVQQPKLDDADVAVAATYSNPGAIQIIQGIGDEAKTVRQLVQAQIDGRLMPHTFRAIERNGRTDFLISDGLPVTNKLAAQYKETGMFQGMRVTLPGGMEAEIVSPAASGSIATVKPLHSNLEVPVVADDIMPGKTSQTQPQAMGISDAGSLYKSLRNTVISQNSFEAEQAGIPQFGWLDDQAAQMLPDQIEAFLDNQGIHNPVARATLKNYFGIQRLNDFRATAPAEVAEMRSLNARLTVEQTARRMSEMAPASLDAMASAKGLRWEIYPGQPGGTLRDIWSQKDFPMEHEEAAREFLRHYNVEMPDLTPATTVPGEVGEFLPGDGHPGDAEEGVAHTENVIQAYEHLSSHIEEHLADIEQNLAERAAAGTAVTAPSPIVTQTGMPAEVAAFLGGGGMPPTGGPLPPTGGPPSLPPPAGPSLSNEFAGANPKKLWEVEQKLSDLWFRYGVPFRGATLQLQEMLENAGVRSNGLWEDYNAVSTGRMEARNYAQPWHKEWNDIMSFFPRRMLRDGTVTRIEELGDYNQKVEAMQRAGYTPEMMDAQRRINDFNNRFFNITGLPTERWMPNYMSHVRKFAETSADPWGDANSYLPPELQFFGEYAREGGLNARQMDAELLGHTMVRSFMNEKYMGPAWAQMVQKWNQPGIPDSFKNLVTNWLNVVRTGHNPGYSFSVQGVRSVLNRLGVPVTDRDVMGVWNPVIGNMYRGLLGWRPKVVFRDATQPWMAGTRIGFDPLRQSYARFFAGGDERAAMWERAHRGGWVEAGAVKAPNADVFSSETLPAGQLGSEIFTPRQMAVRGAATRLGDVLHDMMPRTMRKGIGGTAFDPLYAFSKEGEFNRLISGDAGWQLATDALSGFRGEHGDMARLLSESKAGVYPRPIRNLFRTLVEGGRDEEAANLLANEAANSQFRYGLLENPVGLQTQDGRFMMMLGSFTQQYIQFMKEGLTNGTVPERAGFAARHAMVAGAIKAASLYTGYKLTSWYWHNALGYQGPPWLDMLNSAQRILGGAANLITGQKLSPDQQRSYSGNGRGLDRMLPLVNPTQGLFETVGGIDNAVAGANPGDEFFRFLITGERGSERAVHDWIQNLQIDPSTGRPVVGGPGRGAPLFPITVAPAGPGSGAR